MVADGEVAVPFGRDLRGQDYDIYEADPKIPYFCPKCKQPLSQRRGEERREHFAHLPNTPDRHCPWLSAGGVEQEFARMRKDAIEVEDRRIRLFIETDPYSGELRLYGQLPTLGMEELALLKARGEDIQVSARGTRQALKRADFLPSMGRAWFELDPAASGYEVEIKPKVLGIGGKWGAERISEHAVFLGDSFRAEMVVNPRHLESGAFLYLVGDHSFGHADASVKTLKLGGRIVTQLDVDESSRALCSQVVGHEVFIDDDPIRVDVISPFLSDPRSTLFGFLELDPGSEGLIAIHPPGGTDPEISIIPLPLNEARVLTIAPQNDGEPRFVRIASAELIGKRLMVYLPGRLHRRLILQVSARTPVPGAVVGAPAREIGLKVQEAGGERLYRALDTPRVEFSPMGGSEDPAQLPKLELQCPPGFRVRLQSKSMDQKGAVTSKQEGLVELAQFMPRIQAMFEAGAIEARVQFGTLGTITIESQFFAARAAERVRLHKTEIEKSARDAARRVEEEREARRRQFEARSQAEHENILRKRIDAELHLSGKTLPHISRAWIRRALGPDCPADDVDVDKWRRTARRRIKELGLRKRAENLETRAGGDE